MQPRGRAMYVWSTEALRGAVINYVQVTK
jgi:hypothetical protein